MDADKLKGLLIEIANRYDSNGKCFAVWYSENYAQWFCGRVEDTLDHPYSGGDSPLEAAQNCLDLVRGSVTLSIAECEKRIRSYCREKMEHGNFIWRENPHNGNWVVTVFEEKIGLPVSTQIGCSYTVSYDGIYRYKVISIEQETLEEAMNAVVKKINAKESD